MVKCIICGKDISDPDTETSCPSEGWVVITQVWEDDTNWPNEAALHKKCADTVILKRILDQIWSE